MEIAGLTQEKEDLAERLRQEQARTKQLRDTLWREQSMRASLEGTNKDLKNRLLHVKGVIENNLDSLLSFPELLR